MTTSKKSNCDKCKKNAKILLPYGPHNYCKEHFIRHFERRVKRTIRNYGLVKPKEHIAVGLSGGKDSAVTLYLLNKIFSKSNRITAIMVDEGIPKYRDRALKVAKENCGVLGVDYELRSFKEEFGLTMASAMKKISKNKKMGTSCSYCGVLRRSLLNKTAKEIKADKVATGHNLDDETQSIVMNFFDNDLRRLARLGAVAGILGFKQFVPRIKPLYETPETEVTSYANFLGIKYFRKEESCPFRWQAKRNAYRSMLDKMEEKFPGTKYSILRSFIGIKPKIKEFAGKSGKMGKCEICGGPSSGRICQTCKQIKKLVG